MRCRYIRYGNHIAVLPGVSRGRKRVEIILKSYHVACSALSDRTSILLDCDDRSVGGSRSITTARIVNVGPAAASAIPHIGTRRLPFLPVSLDIVGSVAQLNGNLIAGTMPLEQVVLAVDTPRRPWSLVLALVTHIVLLMSAALTIPGVFINGDTDPRVLLRASSVTDGHTFSLGVTGIVFGIVAVAVARHFLSHTRFRFTHTSNFHILRVCVGSVEDVAHEASFTSKTGNLGVDQIIAAIFGERCTARLVGLSTSIDILTVTANFHAKSVSIFAIIATSSTG